MSASRTSINESCYSRLWIDWKCWHSFFFSSQGMCIMLSKVITLRKCLGSIFSPYRFLCLTCFWQFLWELPPAGASLVMTNLFRLGIHYDQNDHSEPSTVSRRKASFQSNVRGNWEDLMWSYMCPDCLCTRPTRQSYPQQLLTEMYSLVTDRDFTLSVITGWEFLSRGRSW